MLLLACSGQRSAALAQYHTCCRVLAQELDVEPAAETVALYRQIHAARPEFWSPIREPPTASRLSAFLEREAEAAGLSGPVFVEREPELKRLNGYLKSALSGRGQVVFVTGEAGTGKTALVQEFARRAQGRHEALVVAGGNCNAYTGVGDPYLPFREILAALTGDVESRWAASAIGTDQAHPLWGLIPYSGRLLVEKGPDLIGTLIDGPLLAARAASAVPGGARWLDQLKALVAEEEPGRGKASLGQMDLFEQYAAVLASLARERPLLLVVDDLQWADAGSVGLLFQLGRQLAGSRILIVGLYRPADVALGRGGEQHPLEAVVYELQRYYGQIEVRLGQSTDRRFVESFLDSEPNRLGARFRQALYGQTRGHPLFTVEMLRGMQERGDLVQDEDGCWVEGPAVDWASLPARVEAAIGERVNRLPRTLQETLKVAGVEGEEFTAEVVAQVRGLAELEMVGQLSSRLDRRHRLVREQGSQQTVPGGQRISRYRFRHILFQKYVYNTLDEAERAYLHKAVGDALEQLYEGETQGVAVQLARHYHEAAHELKAVGYLQQAGERAVRGYAYQEAVLLFDQAVALLQTLPDTPERARQELAVQIARGNALIIVKGFASPEVGQAYTRARDLCQHAEVGIASLLSALWGLWVNHFTRAEHQVERELGELLLRLAQRAQDQDLLLQAHHALWTSFLFVGDFASAQAHVEQGLAIYDRRQHHSHSFVYSGHDPGVCCRTLGGPLLWFLGYPEQALQRSNEAVALARELSDPGSLALALRFLAALHHLRLETRAVREQAEATIALAAEHGLGLWGEWAGTLLGWALVQQGQEEPGIAQMRRSLATFQAAGTAHDMPYQLALFAEAYATVGQTEEALSAVDEALTTAEAAGGCYYEAELHRLKGELLLTRSKGAPPVQAEACFQQAISVARRQRARSWELRAAMSLSRLWQKQGKKKRARQRLAQIYDWFTEGFDTADLREAKELLVELGT